MVCFVVLVALLVIFFTISVCAGSVQISISDILRQFRGEQDELYAAILFQIRIPRTFAAILLGGALALSGYLLQTFFHNPIAGPFVLGISSGAKLFVAVVMIVFLRYSRTLSSVDLIVAAFAGLYIISLFLVHHYIGLVVAALIFGVMVRMSNVPFRFIVKGLKPIMMMLVFTALLHLFCTPGKAIFSLGVLHITIEGVQKCIFLTVRLTLMMIGSSLMTLTTTPNQLTDGIEQFAENRLIFLRGRRCRRGSCWRRTKA